jgi:cytoskeletal protein CcmA (bactofilin family)
MSMWNRRKDEEQPVTKPVSAPPRVAEPTKEPTPMSTFPNRPHGQDMPAELPVKSGGSAVLGKSVIVKGQIFSREDLTIDGEVEGTVELQEHRLTVGPNGKVMATIKAREICVIGSVNGNVEASDKIDIRKDAKLVGDIRTARIVIEDGAYFKGNIDIVRPPAAAPTAKPQAVANPAKPAAAAAAGTSSMGNPGPGNSGDAR